VRVVSDQVKKAIPAQLRQKKKYVSSMQSVSHSEQLVDVWCKDLRTIRLGFGCFTDARKLVPTVPPPLLCGPFTGLEGLLTPT
jgi:monoamine oxidase